MSITQQENNLISYDASLGSFGKAFQEKFLQAAFSDTQFAEQMLEVFDASYLDLKYLQFLAEKYFAYGKKYRTFPTLTLLVTIIKDELKTGVDVTLRDQIISYIQRMRSNPDMGDLQYVKDKTLDFCRKQALRAALEKAVDKMHEENYETIVDDIKSAVMVGTAPSLGHNFQDDLDARLTKLVRNCVPTGIAELDKKEILNGGLASGELGIVIGSSGAGKCTNHNTYIDIKYTGIKIDGKLYKPWEKLRTTRGEIYARDITESDELIIRS